MNRETVDQIIFAMENQAEEFLIDLWEGTVLPAEEAEASFGETEDPSGAGDLSAEGEVPRYCPVPPWTPADGFRLMERFALTLKNPLYREALKDCLAAGHGVFRRFKDTLKERPDIERLWFSFKYRQMRRYIAEWLQRQEEGASLAWLGPEPEDTENLILEDFTLESVAPEPEGEAPPSLLAYLCGKDKAAFLEGYGREPAAYAEELYREARRPGPGERNWWEEEGFLAVAGVNPAGLPAGFVWGTLRDLGGGDGLTNGAEAEETVRLLRIRQLFVEPDFRGLGLAKELVDRLLDSARQKGAERIDWSLPRESFFLDSLLDRFGFSQARRTYSMDCFEEP